MDLKFTFSAPGRVVAVKFPGLEKLWDQWIEIKGQLGLSDARIRPAGTLHDSYLTPFVLWSQPFIDNDDSF